MAENTRNTNTAVDSLDKLKDSDGNLIDPPVLPEFEQRIAAAANAGDDVLLQEVQTEYNKAREKEQRAVLRREAKRKGN